jgi:hypothetical protein
MVNWTLDKKFLFKPGTEEKNLLRRRKPKDVVSPFCWLKKRSSEED